MRRLKSSLGFAYHATLGCHKKVYHNPASDLDICECGDYIYSHLRDVLWWPRNVREFPRDEVTSVLAREVIE